jgi:hypothetical protein
MKSCLIWMLFGVALLLSAAVFAVSFPMIFIIMIAALLA